MQAKSIPDVFSTHSAAKFCRVTPMTIIRWIEEGRINAYKTPGGHRRIMRADLEVFCLGAGIPLEWASTEESGVQKVLIIATDKDEVTSILDALVDAEAAEAAVSYQIETAENLFDAGRLLIKFSPEVIFLDLDFPGANLEHLIASIRAEDDSRSCRIVGLRSSSSPRNLPVDRELTRPLGRQDVRQATGPMPVYSVTI